jgi:hypothetical protein
MHMIRRTAVFLLSVSAATVLVASTPAPTPTSTDSVTASTGDVKRYWIGGGRAPAGIPNLAYVVQKGANLVPSGPQAINYEQAFALNDAEASYARARGWLARTCGGAEIHPANIPSVTLLDPTNASARAWRAGEIARLTNERGYRGTYLDTLRSYHPEGFYDGVPCNITDAQWLAASVDMVTTVKAKTGKLVIANGAGMGSGRKYFTSNRAADPIIAAADAVQIEHFARGRYLEDDVRFVDELTSRGKLAFAKCDSTATTCTSAFTKAARPEMRFLHLD